MLMAIFVEYEIYTADKSYSNFTPNLLVGPKVASYLAHNILLALTNLNLLNARPIEAIMMLISNSVG